MHTTNNLYFALRNQHVKSSPENIFKNTVPGESGQVLVLDESLQTRSAGLCDLFLTVSESSVRLALKEVGSGKFLALEVHHFENPDAAPDWKFRLEQIAASSKLLRSYEFSKPVIGIVNQKYSLVPETLYRNGDDLTYFNFNHGEVPGLEIFNQSSEPFQIRVIWALPSELLREVNHLFENPKIYHFSSVFAEACLLEAKSKKDKSLWLHAQQGLLDICILDGNKLLFMNSFRCPGPEDMLYYTLFALEQLDLDPRQIKTSLFGDVAREAAIYKTFKKYLPELRQGSRPESLKFSYGFREVPEHHHFPLFSLALCES